MSSSRMQRHSGERGLRQTAAVPSYAESDASSPETAPESVSSFGGSPDTSRTSVLANDDRGDGHPNDGESEDELHADDVIQG